jgi:hypothetical protein
LEGAVVEAAGAVVVAGAVCFLCFFTLVGLVVSVLLVGVELEAGGVWAITVPSMRERPIKAEANVFMVFVSYFGCRIRLP